MIRLCPPWLALLLFLIGTPALAHGFLVLGAFTSSPPTPQPGAPFTLQVKLTDVTERPVEHADIFVDFRAPGSSAATASGGGSARAVPVRTLAFKESGATPGLYTAQVELPSSGAWSLVLRDHTYSYEEARTTPFTFNVGQGSNQASYDFIFPPTAPKPATLKTWLMWVIGIPIAAGIVITAIVLLGKKKEREGEGELPRET